MIGLLISTFAAIIGLSAASHPLTTGWVSADLPETCITAFQQDSLPPLHTLKEKDISSVQSSFEEQTIKVSLKSGIVYTYHRVDWDFEDHYSATSDRIKAAVRGITMIYTKVQNPPEFSGGDSAWNRYLQEFCSKHSQEIRRRGPADISIRFIVHMKGQVSDINVIADEGHSGLAELALQAINESPLWIPATQNGHTVISYKLQHVVLRL